MKRPLHINWLVDTGQRLPSADGKDIEVWEFQHQNDEDILSEWAAHFRNHYCLDSQIDTLIKGTGKSKAQFLNDIKFPDKINAPGPSIRSGDFAEILILDYLEFILNYWVPRTHFINKNIRNESTKGSDTIGLKILSPDNYSPDDEMIIIEVKAALTDTKDNRLQNAIDDSAKDEIRLAESLNALKEKFFEKNQQENAAIIERFQNITDHPYQEKSGAAAVLEKNIFEQLDFSTTVTSHHYNQEHLSLIIIRGENMMPLVHSLYDRAANEA